MRISKIHLIGMQLQEAAATIQEARERMSQTCDICSRRGIGVQCRYCVVLDTHNYVVDAIKALEEYRRRKHTYIVKGRITLDMQIKERRCDDVKGYV